MSFFLNDDDSDGGNAAEGGDAFLCPNCGGTESYEDDTGNLFCGLCFSQSQTQNEAEFDYEDINAHVARGRRGQMLGVRYNKHGRRGQGRKDLQEFDTSRPLPSLEECLNGYTIVIQACLESACTLLKLSEQDKHSVKNSVRYIWLKYLETWQEGADFYRRYHPEVRISMRDSFIIQHLSFVSKFLKNQAVEKTKAEVKKEDEENLSDSEPDDDDDDDDDDNSEAVADTKKYGSSTQATLSGMMTMYLRKTPQDAALRVYPTMQTIASLLLTALSKLGVSAHHITRWIANGDIPLLNAYKQCFSPSLQSSLELTKLAFRLGSIPSNHAVEHKAKLLLFAARQDPNLLPSLAVPLLTARLVDDLKLGRQVLNIALALLGEPTRSEEIWLPAPLKGLIGVDRKEHVLAAIVVACKLCPGWQLRKYTSDPLIPWSEEQVELVPSLSSYMDFVKTKIMDGRNTESKVTAPPGFLMRAPEFSDQAAASKHRNVVLTGEPNPNQPSQQRLQKHHEWKLKLKKRKATWADANGLGQYVVYENRYAPLKTTHPQYQSLLEFMAHTTDVKAATIHLFVLKLDGEIHQRHEADLISSRIKPPPKKRKRRKKNEAIKEMGEDSSKSQVEPSLESSLFVVESPDYTPSQPGLANSSNIRVSRGPFDDFQMSDESDSPILSGRNASPSLCQAAASSDSDAAEDSDFVNASQPLF